MSTLRLDTIQDQGGNNASTPDEIYSGRAKAWVNFDGTTGTGNNDVTIRASFNVSSVNDDDLGVYTINLTNSLPDSDYSVTVTHGASPGMTNVQGLTANSFQIETFNSSAASVDRSIVCAVIHR